MKQPMCREQFLPHCVRFRSCSPLIRGLVEFSRRVEAYRVFHAAREQVEKFRRITVFIELRANVVELIYRSFAFSLPEPLVFIRNMFRVVDDRLPKHHEGFESITDFKASESHRARCGECHRRRTREWFDQPLITPHFHMAQNRSSQPPFASLIRNGMGNRESHDSPQMIRKVILQHFTVGSDCSIQKRTTVSSLIRRFLRLV